MISKYLYGCAAIALLLPMPALSQDYFEDLDNYVFIGNAGLHYPDGIVTSPPGGHGADYLYVSTYGGLDGYGSLEGVGGEGSPTNGSLLATLPFHASEGDRIVFSFDYVTSDGAGYADYAWARLYNGTSPENSYLIYTARTTPDDNTVPGFSMPSLNADLIPPRTEIKGGAPTWSMLGDSSGTCWDVGCGRTGWVTANFEVPKDGEYRLQFGVTNWDDTLYDSGMAIKPLTSDFTPIKPPERTLTEFGGMSLYGDVGDSFDHSLPTVVLTHGWQPREGGKAAYTGKFGSVDFIDETYSEIKKYYNAENGHNVNVVVFSWEDAFTEELSSESNFVNAIQSGIIYRNIPTALLLQTGSSIVDAYRKIASPLPFIDDAGIYLGKELTTLLGNNYDQPIHLIGHSYGSAVNNWAALELSPQTTGNIHVTVLDAPTHTPLGLGVSIHNYEVISSPESTVDYVDNYYGDSHLAFGGPILGAELLGGYIYAGDTHQEVWKTYKSSINPAGYIPPGGDVISSSNGGFIYSAALGDNGYYSYRPGQQNQSAIKFNVVDAILNPIMLQHATISDSSPISVSISEGSDGYGMFLLDVPDNASTFMFDLAFDLLGYGDWLEVLFGDRLLGAYRSEVFGDTTRSLMFDFSGYAGTTDFLTLYLADAGPDPSSVWASNFQFITHESVSPSPIPVPASAYLMILGLVSLGAFRRRSSQQRSIA